MSKLPKEHKFIDLSDYGRPIAKVIANSLRNTSFTPIHVTISFIISGLIAIYCIIQGHYWLAAFFLIFKSILDAADGELARIKKTPSYTGRYLDSVADIILNALFFIAIWYITSSSIWICLAAFIGLQLQGTLYNYYYVILRNKFDGDTTSRVFENETPIALEGEKQKHVDILFRLYKLFYGVFDKTIYTLKLELDGGNGSSSKIGTAGMEITEPTSTKEGFTFDGWYTDDAFTNEFIFDKMPAENMTIYAKWQANEYTITLNLDGGTGEGSLTKDFDTVITEPIPTKEGYTFGGWYADAEFTTAYIFTTIPVEDITLYAKWNINSYTLQFVDNDGTVLQTADYEYQADLSSVTPPVSIKTGYSFTDWDMSLPSTMPASNVTLTAQYSINQYTITFDTNAGSEVVAINQDYMSEVTEPVNPIKEGYTFGGWYSDTGFTTVYSFTTIPAEDITLYAKWNINSYTLQFVDTDGAVLQTANYEYNTDLIDGTMRFVVNEENGVTLIPCSTYCIIEENKYSFY